MKVLRHCRSGRVGEASILGDLANSLSASLTDVMRWVYWWHTVIRDPSDVDEETVCVKLNTDFETAHLNGQELSAWQAGAISRDTLLHNLRQGEILPPGRSGEQEVRMIETENPDSYIRALRKRRFVVRPRWAHLGKGGEQL